MIFFNIKTNQGFYFKDQVAEIVANNQDDLISGLRKIEHYLDRGFYIAGYISYEAGYYLIDEYIKNIDENLPLMQFKIFKSKIEINGIEGSNKPLYIYDTKYSEDQDIYSKKLDKIRQHIIDGDTYQLNYTIQIDFKTNGAAKDLYHQLCQRQNAEFSAFLEFEKYAIISLSPELFIKRQGNKLTSKPMKGTSMVTKDVIENNNIIAQMKQDPKTLSENAMIVDLIRNDMSILAKKNTVKVIDPFEVQTFNTVNQLITTVECEIDERTVFFDIIKALFPSGSITGTPKIRTMEIISKLEARPRGVYCGTIGYIMPNRDFCFNVAIRTILYDKVSNNCNMGIGGGIIYEAKNDDEFSECILKSQFLRSINDYFEIFETMLYQNGKIENLTAHIKRLENSAKYFGFNYNLENILTKINQTKSSDRLRIRLAINQLGIISLKTSKIEPIASNKICLSDITIDCDNIFLNHKTSKREIYNSEYQKYSELGFLDVIFTNKEGFVTEGSRHNIFIQNQQLEFITPPIKDGLLPGTMRETVINSHNVTVKSITIDDLTNAKAIFLSNAINGLVEVTL